MVVDERNFSETGSQLPRTVHKNIGYPGHPVSGCELPRHDPLPGGISGKDPRCHKGSFAGIHDQVTHIGVQCRGQLMDLPGVETYGLIEKKNVCVDISIQKFRFRGDKANPERRKPAFLAQASDIKENLTHLVQHLPFRKLLVFFSIRNRFVVNIINGIYKKCYSAHKLLSSKCRSGNTLNPSRERS